MVTSKCQQAELSKKQNQVGLTSLAGRYAIMKMVSRKKPLMPRNKKPLSTPGVSKSVYTNEYEAVTRRCVCVMREPELGEMFHLLTLKF